jgi:hypothetical protein
MSDTIITLMVQRSLIIMIIINNHLIIYEK